MNRYIKAMEIGLTNEKLGITYNDLIKELDADYGHNMSVFAECTFFYWFVDNFSATNYEPKLYSGWKTQFEYCYYFKNNVEKTKSNLTESGESLYKQLEYFKWFLNGSAAKQYLDYLELQESRKTAQTAQIAANTANQHAITSTDLAKKSIKLSTYAIIISSVLGLLAIIIPLIIRENMVKPPYDVKVIEDIRTKELEKENKDLSEKLYNAELMIKALQTDSLLSNIN